MSRRAVHRQAPLDRTLIVVAAPWFERRQGKSSQTLRRWPHAVERRAVKRKAFGCKAVDRKAVCRKAVERKSR